MNAAHQHEAVALPGEPDDPGIRVSDCAGTLTPEMIEILEIMAEYNDNAAGERVVLSACHVSNEEKFDILDYINRKNAEWITQGGVDEEWDAYVEELNKMGVDEYVRIYQEAYDAVEEYLE